jgi:hypothetical protein
MDEDSYVEDPTLAMVEGICTLADAIKAHRDPEIKRRLFLAMDAVITKLQPPGARGRLVDVTGSN